METEKVSCRLVLDICTWTYQEKKRRYLYLVMRASFCKLPLVPRFSSLPVGIVTVPLLTHVPIMCHHVSLILFIRVPSPASPNLHNCI